MENIFKTVQRTPLYDTSLFPSSNYAAEYLASVDTTKLLDRIPRCTDDLDRNIYIGYHLARKGLCITEEKLRVKSAEAWKQRHILDDQWKRLAENEQHFRERFQVFNRFIIENGEKRVRATKRIEDLKKIVEQRTKVISDLKSELKQLKDLKKYMDEDIAAMKIYEIFLHEVVRKYPSQFTTVLDIIERYEALLLARKELSVMQAETMNNYDAARSEFDKLLMDKYVVIAGLKNHLSELHKRYERAQQSSQKWQNVYHSVNLGTIEKLRETEIVKSSCRQIYLNICERKQIPPVYENDYLKQFDIIKKCLLKYEQVNKMLQNLEEEKFKLSEEACVSNTTE